MYPSQMKQTAMLSTNCNILQYGMGERMKRSIRASRRFEDDDERDAREFDKQIVIDAMP